MERINRRENLIRLIDQYQKLIFSICLKTTGDYFAAEDLTQETFLAAYRHWDSFDGANEKTWLCRIASNKSIDYMRAAARKVTAIDEEKVEKIPASAEPLREIINKEVMNNFARAIDALEEPYRTVSRQFFIEGKNAREIAERSGGKTKTIQTQIYRARSMLKKSIRKEDLLI